jgi:hypothetical protein
VTRSAAALLWVAFALLGGARPAHAQEPAAATHPTAGPRPFATGERLEYDLRYAGLRVGRGSAELLPLETIRGRVAYHAEFRVTGGTWFYHVNDVLSSWIDTTTITSLRFAQDNREGGRHTERQYEIFADRAVFRERADTVDQQSMPDPLDDAAFLYFVRTVPLELGQTYEWNRYFRPDRNPVKVIVLRKERITVPAGTFDAIVVRPIIKTRGIFAEGGEAQLWLADDSTRILLQMKTKLPIGSIGLFLTSYRPGSALAAPATARPDR